MSVELYPYQKAGARFLKVAGSALVADEMGTGKTLQTIAAIEDEQAYPALVVCPNSVKRNWEREFGRYVPERRVAVAGQGTKAAEAAVEEVSSGYADVLVINWEAIKALSRLASFGSIRLEPCSNCDPNSRRKPSQCQREDKSLNLIRWAVVVADEVHRAKDPQSLQTRALWALGDRAERRIAMTGTPIANNAEDLWSVMRFVAPLEYPTKWTWLDRYAEQTPNIFSGGVDIGGLREDRREELDKYFLPRFIRRTKAQVLPDLPPKVYERRDVVLNTKQKKAYDQMEKEMLAGIDGGIITAENGLVAMLRLRQLACAYGEVTSSINWKTKTGTSDPDELARIVDEQVRLSEPSSKLDELENVLDELGDRQAVIFAESRQLIELAGARFEAQNRRFGYITGAVPQDKRQENLEAFRRGDLQYMLVVIAAGGEGVDGLQAADTCIFLQRPWSAVQNKQAEDRLHRMGQEGQSVTYIDIVTAGSVEEKVFEVLERKNERLQNVVRD